MHAMEIRNLCKTFDTVTAVNEASFVVPEESIFGLIGRNGAGKTTTIRMMMNIYTPDRGEVIFRGQPVGQEFKNRVGYLPEERGLYKKMKVLDTLLFFAELKGKRDAETIKKAHEYLERFELKDREKSKMEELSKGNQQKIQFIATILHDPEFIILDEPFSGLDPINTTLLKDIVLDLRKQGKVIILSTHLMDFAEKMCDHLAMIDNGRIVINGAMTDIKNRYSQRNVSLVYEGDISFLAEHPIVEKVENFGNSTGIRVKNPADIQNVLGLLVEHQVQVKKFDANDISLHEIFVELVGRDPADEMTMEAPHV